MRILIHRLGSLGDTIVALPAFRVVRQTYPDAHITVLTNPPVSEKAAPLESVVENMGLFDDALYYPMASRDYAKLARLHSEIRRRRFDLYVSLTFGRHLPSSIRDYLYFKTAGIGRVVGLPFDRRDRVCLKVGDGPLHEHEARRLIRRARAVNPTLADSIDPDDAPWTDLKLTPAELAQGDELLRQAGIAGNFLVASVGAKLVQKDWGVARWNELFGRLGPRYNMCGKSGPRVSAAIMRHARLFVGHDSGPMHLAAAAGIRCVAIFCAHQPPGRWFPLGRGHAVFYPYEFFRTERWDDVEYQQHAISTITADEVAAAAEKILG